MHTKFLLLVLTVGTPAICFAQDQSEATVLRDSLARESHRAAYDPEAPSRFKPSDHVFVSSAIAIDFTYRKATVTLPLYRGLSPAGESVYYILTDASDLLSHTHWLSTMLRSSGRRQEPPEHKPPHFNPE